MKRLALCLVLAASSVAGCRTVEPTSAVSVHPDLAPARPGTPELRYYPIADT